MKYLLECVSILGIFQRVFLLYPQKLIERSVSHIDKTRSKFNIDNSENGKLKRTYKGITYASLMEMQYFKEWIEPRLETGEISDVKKQIKYQLQPEFDYCGKHFRAINYISDYDITFSDGTFKVIDVKGMLKNEDKIKEKMFKYNYPTLDFEFIGKSIIDGGWVELDIILKARKERSKVKSKKNKLTEIKGDK